jgi:exosortase/archaeosortase family protein
MSTSDAIALPSRRAALRGHRATPRRQSPVSRLGRILGALALLATVVIALLNSASYRAAEALGAARLLGGVVDGDISTVGDVYYVTTQSFVQGFRVSPECTSLILIAPLLVLSAILLVFSRARAWRLGLGVVTMIALVFAINFFRLALIGFSSLTWGMSTGYPISHTFVGSVIGILGFVSGLAALLLISVGRRRKR